MKIQNKSKWVTWIVFFTLAIIGTLGVWSSNGNVEEWYDNIYISLPIVGFIWLFCRSIGLFYFSFEKRW